jgi:pimeloyl-ACP methyl ester carboxylesterase
MLQAVALFLALHAFAPQDASGWRDPSPHKVHFITVDESVRLEVLDWGGKGRAILFVGCYLTAHVFDDIGPKLAPYFRVVAVTRRGVGASDRPATGYDAQTRAADILRVIDQLRLERPILVGHSCGGWIVHTIAAEHPASVGGVAFLEGAEDPTLPLSAYPSPSADPAKMPKPVRKEPPVEFPEAERRAQAERPLPSAIRNELLGHKERPQYERMRVPVLAIFRTTTLQQGLELFQPKTDEERAVLFQLYAAMRGMLEKWEADLRTGVPHARIVELPGANLYMFLSNEADIIRELRMFAATLSVTGS